MKPAKRRETRRKLPRIQMPNATERLQKVFGRKVISDEAMRKILDTNQANY
jgi:hypothetical protein